MAYTIAIANQKGGVAKTTSAHNIGVALADKGKRVLLIDLDPQASLTVLVGIEPIDITNNINLALKKDGIPLSECITQLRENLDIVTSIIDLAETEMSMITRRSNELVLSRAIKPVKDDYDYILIDCPPQLTILSINAMACADYMLIPVKTDYLAFRGLTQLLDSINEVQELFNPGIKIIGIIATLHDKRITDDKDILNLLRTQYNVIGVTKTLIAARKGIYGGLSVIENEPESELAISYRNITNKIIKEVEDNGKNTFTD